MMERDAWPPEDVTEVAPAAEYDEVMVASTEQEVQPTLSARLVELGLSDRDAIIVAQRDDVNPDGQREALRIIGERHGLSGARVSQIVGRAALALSASSHEDDRLRAQRLGGSSAPAARPKPVPKDIPAPESEAPRPPVWRPASFDGGEPRTPPVTYRRMTTAPPVAAGSRFVLPGVGGPRRSAARDPDTRTAPDSDPADVPVPAALAEAPIPDWRHSAACREEDPELFFPVGTSGPALLRIAEAKTVCGRCIVGNQCLDWAVESGQDYGVWGGKSEDERRVMK